MAIQRKKLSMDGNTAAAHVSYAFTEVAAICRILAILCMQITHIFSENLQRIDRVCLTIQDEICGIKIYPEIIRANLFEAAQHSNRCLLTGFEQEGLAAALHLAADAAQHGDGAAEILIVIVGGQKADVGGHLVYVDLFGKFAAQQQLLFADAAERGRHQTGGHRAVGEVPFHRAGIAAPQGADGDAGGGNGRVDLFGQLIGKQVGVPDADLAAFQIQTAHLFQTVQAVDHVILVLFQNSGYRYPT